jgi:hypothetical protein
MRRLLRGWAVTGARAGVRVVTVRDESKGDSVGNGMQE